jgi:hypothetical protein
MTKTVAAVSGRDCKDSKGLYFPGKGSTMKEKTGDFYGTEIRRGLGG